MRLAFYRVVAIGFVFCSFGCGQKNPTPAPPSMDSPPVTVPPGDKAPPPAPTSRRNSDGVFITDTIVAYGDGKFTLPCKLDDVEKVLGKASRQEDDSGAHFWDDLGIRTISGIKKSGETEKWIENVGFFYTTTPEYRSSASYKTKSNLKNAYRMPLTFNGVAISKDTDLNKLKAELKGLGGPGSDGRLYYFCSPKGVLDIFSDDQGKIIYIDVRN